MSYDDIKYTPLLEPKKEYKSDIQYERKPEEEIEDSGAEKEDSILEKIEDMLSMVPVFPEDVRQTIEDNIDILKDHITNNTTGSGEDKDKDNDNKEPEGFENNPIESPSDDIDTSAPDTPTYDYDDNMPFVVPVITQVAESIDELDSETLVEVVDSYLADLQAIILEHVSGVNHCLIHSGVEFSSEVSDPYDQPSSELPNNLKHLGDEIVKSQIIRDQRGRLFRKVSDKDTLSTFLGQISLASIKHSRYKEADYYEEDNLVDMYTNRELDNVRECTIQQNKNSLYNLHKQLNSSNLVLSDYMKMQTREMQLKITLIKEECLKNDNKTD